MKKIILPVIFFLLILTCPAFYFAKGKSTPPPAGDTCKRQYHTAAIKPKKQKTIYLSDSLQYTVTSQGDGPIPQIGDKVAVLYTGKLTNDTVFDASSRHGYAPFAFHLGKDPVIAGWDSVLLRLHGGDKARLRIPGKYGYGAQGRGPIPPNATLVFDVEIISIAPPTKPWDAKGKDTITTPSGLKIVFYECNKDNIMPKTGHVVVIDYSGFLLDGSLFDSSVERGMPYSFTYGKDPVIKGWSEGVGMMHKGDRAKIIIPYTLGYGAQGYPPVIPPKADLIFDLHLIDVK